MDKNLHKPLGIWDRELTYEETHLPVNHHLIFLALVDPSATYMNMEALYWSIINSPNPSLMMYLDPVSRRRAELVDKL